MSRHAKPKPSTPVRTTRVLITEEGVYDIPEGVEITVRTKKRVSSDKGRLTALTIEKRYSRDPHTGGFFEGRWAPTMAWYRVKGSNRRAAASDLTHGTWHKIEAHLLEVFG